jgi:predicted cupin superfamily sugar epimerase
MPRIDDIIEQLGLQKHPEGGYYNETYRSRGKIPKQALGPDFGGDRNYSTAIYFLLTSDNFSAFHRIRQDEIWHFYEGSPIRLHILDQNGKYEEVILGNDLGKMHHFQYVVQAGHWFASEVSEHDSYSLAGCTVSPGFDFEDFEMASGEQLVAKYPSQTELIKRLTRF